MLRAPSPRQRQRRVLQYFGEFAWHKFHDDKTVLSALPKWLATHVITLCEVPLDPRQARSCSRSGPFLLRLINLPAKCLSVDHG